MYAPQPNVCSIAQMFVIIADHDIIKVIYQNCDNILNIYWLAMDQTRIIW